MSDRLFRVLLWFVGFAGFDIGDRIFDHVLDQWADSVPWLAWLQ